MSMHWKLFGFSWEKLAREGRFDIDDEEGGADVDGLPDAFLSEVLETAADHHDLKALPRIQQGTPSR